MIADAPPAIVVARPVEPRGVHGIAVWGNSSDLSNLKASVEERGWRTRWLQAGGPAGTTMLLILVLPSTPPEDVEALMTAINAKRLGDLRAGLAEVGAD